jgi:hypothetical protein
VKTADLIDALAQDAPVRWKLSSLLAMAFAVGAVIAAVIFMAGVHMRPDFSVASQTMRVQFKFLFALTLLSGAAGAMVQAGRPESGRPALGLPELGFLGAMSGPWPFLLAAAPVLLVVAVIAELFAMPSRSWMPRLIGQNAMYCLTIIPALALAPLACLLLAFREGAPARPGLAGAVAGLAAGGIAAVLYASHCPDDSPLFVAVWYSSAIAAVVAAGRFAGTRLLKW